MPSASSAAPARPPAALADPLPCQRGLADLWFSDLPGELDQAKASCQQCPLLTACRAGAIERAEPCGVWGGRSSTRASLSPANDPEAVP